VTRPRAEEEGVRRLLESAAHPPVPADLLVRATARGLRGLRRRRALRRTLWTLAAVLMVAFLVWAAVTQPWLGPPTRLTPPVEGL
jgi:ferric-dicitrate binding protein FerR (iron transport regulator)